MGQSKLPGESIVTAWSQPKLPADVELTREPGYNSTTVRHVELLLNELLPMVGKVVIVNEAVGEVLQIGPLEGGSHAVMDPDFQKDMCREYVDLMKANVKDMADYCSKAVWSAMYDYAATNEGELAIQVGDVLTGVSSPEDGWLTGTVKRTGESGSFPEAYAARKPGGKVVLVTTSRHFKDAPITDHSKHFNAPHPWTWHMNGGGFKVLENVWALAEIGAAPAVQTFPEHAAGVPLKSDEEVEEELFHAESIARSGSKKELKEGDLATLRLTNKSIQVQVQGKKAKTIQVAKAENPEDWDVRVSPAKSESKKAFNGVLQLDGNPKAGHYFPYQVDRIPSGELKEGYKHGMTKYPADDPGSN